MNQYSSKKKSGIDWSIIFATSILLLFGIISLMNVLSQPFDGSEKGIQDFLSRQNFNFISRQLGNIIVSILISIPVAMTDYKKYKSFLLPGYLILNALLIILLLFGGSTRGVQGWYNVGSGSLSRAFQPSEFCKVLLIAVLSKVASDFYEENGKLKSFKNVLACTILFIIPFILVLLQPDFGTAMVMLAIFISIMFSSGVGNIYIFGAAIAGSVSLPIIYKYLLSYDQKQRIRVFLDPTLDPQGNGYNVIKAKEVIGTGGMTGKGLFTPGTLSQYGHVPERQTDFIFSSIAESVGFLGGLFLVLVYCWLIFRFLYIAFHSPDTYGRSICIGVAAMLFAHVFENIGMNIGLVPVTGIPLPLISYGGSNMMTTMISFAMVISVRYRTVNRSQIQ